jgi:lycopene cyclase domain-containing protein
VTYTVLAVLGVGAAVLLDLVVLRTRLLTRRVFWTAYAIVVFFQLLTNGWLTGRDIVTYDEDTVLGPRLVFAPVEDLLFGFALVVSTLAWWAWWGRRLSPRAAGSRPGTSAAPVERGPVPAPPAADGPADRR